MPRSAQSTVLATIALVCAGCLVTKELDFKANQNPPSIRRVAPPEISYVPATDSADCTAAYIQHAVSFQANYFDDDVDQTLWVLPLINGAYLLQSQGPSSVVQALGDPDGKPQHQSPLICVPRALFTADCNVVQVVVSDDFDKITTEPLDQLLADPQVDSLTWYLAPAASDTVGNPAKPYISFTACLPAPDGGT